MRDTERDRAARRAVAIDGAPAVAAGTVALALGSSPNPSQAEQRWWLAVTGVFVLAVLWAVVRGFRRADEYQRKIQLESMAVAFGAVLVAVQFAGMLGVLGIGSLQHSFELVVFGGVLLWQLVADLRTRWHQRR